MASLHTRRGGAVHAVLCCAALRCVALHCAALLPWLAAAASAHHVDGMRVHRRSPSVRARAHACMHARACGPVRDCVGGAWATPANCDSSFSTSALSPCTRVLEYSSTRATTPRGANRCQPSALRPIHSFIRRRPAGAKRARQLCGQAHRSLHASGNALPVSSAARVRLRACPEHAMQRRVVACMRMGAEPTETGA